MSEEAKPREESKGEPPISRDDLMRYLKAGSVLTTCPHCQNDDWNVLAPDAVEGLAVSRLGGDALVYPESILPTLVMVCNVCSYVWMMARKPIALWIKEHQEPLNEG